MTDTVRALRQELSNIKRQGYMQAVGLAQEERDDDGLLKEIEYQSRQVHASVLPGYDKERMNYGTNLIARSRQDNEDGVYARSVLDTVGAFKKSKDADYTLQKEKESMSRFMHETWKGDTISEEDIERRLSYEYLQQFAKLTDSYGAPTKDMLNNPQFVENVNPETYAYLGTTYNTIYERGFMGEWTRNANHASESRANSIDFVNGVIDNDTYNLRQARIDARYKLASDRSYVGGVASVVQGMIDPVVDNPVPALVGASLFALGSVTGITEVGAIGSVIFMGGTQGINAGQLTQADILHDVYETNPNADREDVLKNTWASWGIVSLLNTADPLATAKIMGVGKGIGWATGKLVSDTIKSPAVKTLEQTTRKEIAPRLEDVAMNTLKDWGLDTSLEIGQEGLEGAVQELGTQRYLGKSWSESLSLAYDSAIENMREASTPSAILSGAFRTPKTVAQLHQVHRNYRETMQNVKRRMADEISSQSPLAQNDPDTNEEVSNATVLQDSRVYIDADVARDNLSNDGLGVADYGEDFQKLLDADYHGERIVMNESTFAKLPPSVRDSIASATSNKDGRPIPQNVSELLSDKKIKELQAEFAKNQQEIIKRENDRLEVKRKLDEQLRNSSNIKRKHQSFIANVGSAFMSAMSETTGIDINTLYDRFKPKYTYVNELDLSKNQRRINQRGITGTFNPKTNEIQLNPNSDFNTVFHETAHWYLNVMRELAKENSQIGIGMSQLVKWSGFDKGIENLTDADFNAMSEKFVAGFTLSLLNTHKGERNHVFDGFKRFLFSLKNQSVFSNLKAGEDKAQHLRKGFESTYGEPLPQLDSIFNNIIDSMFTSDVLNEVQEMDYPRDNILKVIDNIPSGENGINDKIKAKLKEELKKTLTEVDGKIESATQILSIKQALIMSLKEKDMDKVIKNLLDKIPDTLKNKTQIKNYLNRLLKAVDSFQEEADRLEKKILHTRQYQYLEMQKSFGINPHGLDTNTLQALQAKGFIKEDGLLVSDLMSKQQPTFVEDYIKHSQMSREQAFINLVIKTPTAREQAEKLAMNKTIRSFAYDLAKSMSNLEKASAVSHKSLAGALLKALHNAFGDKKTDAVKTKHDIESVAELDVYQGRYKDLSARNMMGNASFENRKVQKALAEGDIQGAVSHTRNEYYLNHKAEFTSKMKLYVDKKLSDFKSFASKTDKTLSKNYDVEVVDLIRQLLHQIGVSDKNPFIDAKVRVEKLIERFPDSADDLRAIAMAMSENTANTIYSDQTYNQLLNTIDLLEALKGLANTTRTLTIGKQKLTHEQAVDKMCQSFDKHKDKVKSLQTENGVASTRRKNLWDKTKEVWREFSHLFTLVENFCQQIDGETLGFVRECVYQPCKDGEVQYKLAKDKYTKRISEALKGIKVEAEPITAYELRRKDDPQHGAWELGKGRFSGATTLELMGIILHMGTNLEKFLDGYIANNPDIDVNDKKAQLKWKQEQFMKFFQRMVDNHHITKEMLDACQEVWNVNKEIAEDVNKASMAIRGFKFKELPSRTIDVTIDGKVYTYNAGYMPAFKNTDIELPHVDVNADIAQQLQQMTSDMILSNPSFLEDRTSATYTLELDPVMLIGKMNDTLRYAYVMPAVVQTKRLLDDPRIRSRLRNKYPQAYEEVFMPFLKRVATMQSAQPSGKIGKFISRCVRGSAMQIMVGNLNNALQQFSNVSTLLLRVSPAELIKSLPVWFDKDMRARILQESDFMRVRIGEQNDGINELFNELLLEGSSFESSSRAMGARLKKVQYFTNKHAYVAQKVTQNVIDYLAYVSAKNTAIKQGKTEEQAIRYAEATVRNCLGSFDLADVASIQASNAYVKMLTMFGGYFYSMYRLCETEIKNAFLNYDITDYRRYTGSLFGVAMSIVAPSIIAEVINGLVGTGDWGNDDDDTDILQSNLFWAPFRMVTASFPVVGKLANTGIDYAQGKHYYSSAMLQSPLLTQASSTASAIKKVMQGDDLQGREIKAMIISAGILLNISAFGVVARPVGYGYDYLNDNIVPDGVYDMVRGFVTGRASEQSKR